MHASMLETLSGTCAFLITKRYHALPVQSQVLSFLRL